MVHLHDLEVSQVLVFGRAAQAIKRSIAESSEF